MTPDRTNRGKLIIGYRLAVSWRGEKIDGEWLRVTQAVTLEGDGCGRASAMVGPGHTFATRVEAEREAAIWRAHWRVRFVTVTKGRAAA